MHGMVILTKGESCLKNPIKEYKRLKRIVDYYEDNMLAMQRCRRYAEFGLLLLSNVQPGDRIYLIGAQLLIFQKPLCCRVEKVEFIGNNDAKIHVKRYPDWQQIHGKKPSP